MASAGILEDMFLGAGFEYPIISIMQTMLWVLRFLTSKREITR